METQVLFTEVSRNAKTGPIPTSITERSSCPTTCPFYIKGCYAKYGPTAMHWRKVSDHLRGISWSEFTIQIRKLSRGQLWRHNVAGDLPHNDGIIDHKPVRQLVAANKGRRGFTYTHHNLENKENLEIIKDSNQAGFTINISTEDVEVADRIMSEHGLPAVAVVNSTVIHNFYKTSSGRQVIVCPATIHDGVSCATCGICQNSSRKSIVVFPAHGVAKKTVNQIVN